MKFVIAFLSLIVVVSVFGATDEDQWAEFKTKHDRHFDAEEDAKRFEIFKNSLRRVEEQNAKYARGESSWTAGLNHFSDRTQEEKNRNTLNFGGNQPPPGSAHP